MRNPSFLLSIILLIKSVIFTGVFKQLLDKNDFQAILAKIESGEIPADSHIKSQFQTKKLEILSLLERITNTLSSKREKQIVVPVFQWGQSKDSILLQVKLSHRFGSPGCLDVTSDPVFNVESNKLLFQVECIQAQQPMIFQLSFELFENGKEALLKRESVGVFALSFAKSQSSIWRELILNEDQRRKFKPKIWYDIESIHPEDMRTFY